MSEEESKPKEEEQPEEKLYEVRCLVTKEQAAVLERVIRSSEGFYLSADELMRDALRHHLLRVCSGAVFGGDE